MMNRCTFKDDNWRCGSYAFNLAREGIKQGDLCDRHYWQIQALNAAAEEREACAQICDAEHNRLYEQCCDSNPEWVASDLATAIRMRSTVGVKARP